MFAHERQKKIVQWINGRGRAEFAELETAFPVSPATLRRDLSHLEARHQIIRVHGGVLSANGKIGEPDLDRKSREHISAKRAIAVEVNQLTPDGSTVLLDSGSTCLECARLLLSRASLTVITNSIPVIQLAMTAQAAVLAIGGKVRGISGALIGGEFQLLDRVRADIAIVGASGLTVTEGAFTTELGEAAMKNEMLSRSKIRVLAADISKLHHPAPIQFADWTQFTHWATWGKISPQDSRLLKKQKVHLLTSSKTTF